MNAKECAAALDGTDYPVDLCTLIKDAAHKARLVIVYGESDDIMGFRGAIENEVDCCNGGTAYLDRWGLLKNDCDADNCPHFAAAKKRAATIEALWCDDEPGPAWSYRTEIPHETFEIFEDGGVYCRGIVFSLSDVERELPK